MILRALRTSGITRQHKSCSRVTASFCLPSAADCWKPRRLTRAQELSRTLLKGQAGESPVLATDRDLRARLFGNAFESDGGLAIEWGVK